MDFVEIMEKRASKVTIFVTQLKSVNKSRTRSKPPHSPLCVISSRRIYRRVDVLKHPSLTVRKVYKNYWSNNEANLDNFKVSEYTHSTDAGGTNK